MPRAHNQGAALVGGGARRLGRRLIAPLLVIDQAGTAVEDLGGGAYRVEKLGATAAWDASAYGTAPLTGNFAIEVEIEQADGAVMVGLDADPDAAISYDNFDVNVYFQSDASFTDGYSVVPPAGLGFAEPYLAGDVVRLARAGDQVTISRAGEVLSSRTLAGEVYFDSTLLTQGASFVVRRVG